MDEHLAMQMSLSNTSSDNSEQPLPYNPYGGGSSSQPPPYNIPPPKKPRGRPPGSKNKPKPPLIVTQENDRAMRPLTIEVAAGTDVIEAIVQYALRRRTGISILSGSGTVNKVTIRYPLSTAPAFTLHGPFSLISFNGSFAYPPSPPPPSSSSSSSSNLNASNTETFGIALAGVQGQIFGGVVGGKVVAGGDHGVKVTCCIFKNPELHRAGGVNDAGEEGDDYDYDDDSDEDGDGDNPNVGADAGGVGSSSGGAAGNEGMAGFNPTTSDPNFMHWAHPRPPNY